MGLLIGGHICAVSVTQGELGSGERWLWGGLGTGLLILFSIPLCFKSNDPPALPSFPKIVRIIPRLLVATILALLPLAPPEKLNPMRLLSITLVYWFS